jgi:hypothetical protein
MLMGDDSQNNKRSSAERAASISRRDFVADTERKLSQARRLFSLGDFLACEVLLRQILETDRLNTKAKALNELTAIKLHRRKLYKKLVDPRPSRTSPSLSDSAQTAEERIEPNLSPETQSHSTGVDGAKSFAFHSDEASDLTGGSGQDPPSAGIAAPQTDTMRERTIAALVQLFNEKEKKIEDWRVPKFNAAPVEVPEAVDAGSEASTDLAKEDAASLAIPWPSLASSQGGQEFEKESRAPSEIDSRRDESAATKQQQDPHALAAKPLAQSTIPLPSPEIVEEIQQLKHGPLDQTETDILRGMAPGLNKGPLAEEKAKRPQSTGTSPGTVPHFPEGREPEVNAAKVIQLPKVSPFEQITSPRKVDKRLVERKLDERSEELKNSEIKTVSIAQIKRYLYKEEYELCARELESIRKRFPENEEIQAFVENTSKRLSELQRAKGFEALAKELMLSASFHYQEGKFPEALIATKEVLRVIPQHQQARQFAEMVQKRIEKEKRKALKVSKVRYCWACGVAVDFISHYCHHCGHRLT